MATAKGESPDGSGPAEGKAETEDPTEPLDHTIEVTKVSDLNGAAAKLGETITYTVTVTNKGNVTVTDIKVTDMLSGAKLKDGESDTIASLAPGASADVHFIYVVTETDARSGSITNKVIVSGKDPKGDPAGNTGETTDSTDPRCYTLTYVVEGDPVYGIPGEGAGAPDPVKGLVYGTDEALAAARTTTWNTSSENGGKRGTWKFTGWSTDTAYADVLTSKKILGNETVYGKWIFTPRKGGGGGGGGTVTPYPKGTTAAETSAQAADGTGSEDGEGLDPFRLGLLNATGDRAPIGLLAGALVIFLGAFAAVDYNDKKKRKNVRGGSRKRR